MPRTHIPCILCQTDDASRLMEKDSYPVVRCRRCGLAYVNPQPDSGEISRFYNDSGVYRDRYPRKKDSKLREAARNLNRLRRFLRGAQRPVRMLDIGCGCGHALAAAGRIGWEAIGVDMCAWEVEYARREFGVFAEVACFPGSGRSANAFDILTLFDLIEHLPDPCAAARECFSLLKPGGLLMVTTPDLDRGFLPGGEQRPGFFCPPEHLFYFNRATLRSLFETAGLLWRGSFLRLPGRTDLKVLFCKRP